MSRRISSCCLLLALPWSALFYSTVPAIGQDIKIRTHVHSVEKTPDGPTKTEQSVSLTIFHAGRVYDYIDNVREVIIFEPAHNRFRIISLPRSLVTTVGFEELRQMLSVAEHAIGNYIERAEKEHNGQTPESARALRFQLEPNFKENWKPVSKELQLTNAKFRYNVKCETCEDAAIHEIYLQYADWMSQLNFVLHPQSMYPNSRLALNEALRQRKLYPLEVQLFSDENPDSSLVASHTISWKLNSFDRTMINDWESQLGQGKLREVTFHEYQEAVLIAAARK